MKGFVFSYLHYLCLWGHVVGRHHHGDENHCQGDCAGWPCCVQVTLVSFISGHHHCGGGVWWMGRRKVYEHTIPLSSSLWLLALLCYRHILGAATRLHHKQLKVETGIWGTSVASAPLTLHLAIVWGLHPNFSTATGLVGPQAQLQCLVNYGYRHCLCLPTICHPASLTHSNTSTLDIAMCSFSAVLVFEQRKPLLDYRCLINCRFKVSSHSSMMLMSL